MRFCFQATDIIFGRFFSLYTEREAGLCRQFAAFIIHFTRCFSAREYIREAHGAQQWPAAAQFISYLIRRLSPLMRLPSPLQLSTAPCAPTMPPAKCRQRDRFQEIRYAHFSPHRPQPELVVAVRLRAGYCHASQSPAGATAEMRAMRDARHRHAA